MSKSGKYRNVNCLFRIRKSRQRLEIGFRAFTRDLPRPILNGRIGAYVSFEYPTTRVYEKTNWRSALEGYDGNSGDGTTVLQQKISYSRVPLKPWPPPPPTKLSEYIVPLYEYATRALRSAMINSSIPADVNPGPFLIAARRNVIPKAVDRWMDGGVTRRIS